jgi:hypothetical protein
MLKFLIWTGLLSIFWWEAEVVATITKNEIIFEIIRVVSNVVVLIVAPYLAWKIRQSETERKEQVKVAVADRTAIMDKLDKSTEVTVKTSEKVIQAAALPEAERISRSVVVENREYFDQLLKEYASETHPERYLSAQEQRESSSEKESK